MAFSGAFSLLLLAFQPGTVNDMGTTAVHVSEAEYLATHYRPDCDWIEGELEERNLGEKNHAKLAERIRALLELQHLFAISEVRLRVCENPTRYRVPDVCAYRIEPDEQIFTKPPLIVVEVLSPEDRLIRLREPGSGLSAHGSRTGLAHRFDETCRLYRRPEEVCSKFRTTPSSATKSRFTCRTSSACCADKSV
jgi:Putative restriction endonuclease